MSSLPNGRVTFSFFDVVGSTRLFSNDPDRFTDRMSRVQRAIRREVSRRGGVVVKTLGDGAFAVFESASAAVDSLVSVQAADDGGRLLPVRAGGHCGQGVLVDGDYVSFAVHVASRVCSAAGAGQCLVSQSVADELAVPVGELLGTYHLRDIVEPIVLWRLCGAGEPPDARPVSRTNVPAPRTSFHGREAELRKLRDWLNVPGLCSVVGPGGVGKTRVTSELALAEAGRWEGGAWLVELATVTVNTSVVDAVGSVLHMKGSPSVQALCEEVARRGETILVLDNCEHVLSEVVDLVEALQVECPRLRLVTTSREPLGIEGERVMRLAPFPTGVAGAAAIAEQLLMERAETAGADVGRWDSGLVRTVCEQLDGLPLAIELAAGRAAELPLSDLLGSLEGGPTELTRRRGPQRHRSVRDLVAWSADLLAPGDRDALLAVAVLPGGFTAGTAKRLLRDVAGANEDAAAILARCSLLDVDGARYRMLAVVRGVVRRMLTDEPGLEESARQSMFNLCLDVAGETDVPMGFLKDAITEDVVLAVIESLRWAVPRRQAGAHQLLRLCRGFADYRMRPPLFDRLCDEVLSWPDHGDPESAMLAAHALRAAVATPRLDQHRRMWNVERAGQLVTVVRNSGSARDLRLCMSAVGIYFTKIQAFEASFAMLSEELELTSATPELEIWRLNVQHDLAILAHDRHLVGEAEGAYRTVIAEAAVDQQPQLAGMAVANLAELLLENSRPDEVLDLLRPWLATEDTEPAAALRWGSYVLALVATGARGEAQRLFGEAKRRLTRTAAFAGATKPCLDALLALDLADEAR